MLWDVSFLDSLSGWAVGDSGVILHTEDGGGSWFREEAGTRSRLEAVTMVDEENGWAVGGKATWWGGGATILKYTGPTYVQPQWASEVLPREYWLGQNFPNPFNPTTTIPYRLSAVSGQQSAVTLKVYNVLGELVETLVDERQRPGRYRARWDASKVASGVYFCCFKAGDYRQTIKMVVMK